MKSDERVGWLTGQQGREGIITPLMIGTHNTLPVTRDRALQRNRHYYSQASLPIRIGAIAWVGTVGDLLVAGERAQAGRGPLCAVRVPLPRDAVVGVCETQTHGWVAGCERADGGRRRHRSA